MKALIKRGDAIKDSPTKDDLEVVLKKLEVQNGQSRIRTEGATSRKKPQFTVCGRQYQGALIWAIICSEQHDFKNIFWPDVVKEYEMRHFKEQKTTTAELSRVTNLFSTWMSKSWPAFVDKPGGPTKDKLPLFQSAKKDRIMKTPRLSPRLQSESQAQAHQEHTSALKNKLKDDDAKQGRQLRGQGSCIPPEASENPDTKEVVENLLSKPKSGGLTKVNSSVRGPFQTEWRPRRGRCRRNRHDFRRDRYPWHDIRRHMGGYRSWPAAARSRHHGGCPFGRRAPAYVPRVGHASNEFSLSSAEWLRLARLLRTGPDVLLTFGAVATMAVGYATLINARMKKEEASLKKK